MTCSYLRLKRTLLDGGIEKEFLGCVSSSRDEGLSDIPEFQVREADG